MPQLTLTTAGQTALAAASGSAPININQVRLGSGRIAANAIAAATALQTPISGATYTVGAPSGSRSAVVADISEQAYAILCTEAGNAAIAPTEMGMFDTAGNMIAYHAAAVGANIFNKPVGLVWRFYATLMFQNAQSPATITFSVGAVLPATDARAGIAELATNAEAIAGTDAARAMTPAADKAALDNRIATQAQVDAGTNNTDFVTPLLLVKNAGGGVDVQDFSADGVWTKPDDAAMVYVELWGGGGVSGIGEGGGGDYAAYLIHADNLRARENVYIGDGGTLPEGHGETTYFISDPNKIAALGGGISGSTARQIYITDHGNPLVYEIGGATGHSGSVATLEQGALRWYAGTARLYGAIAYTPSQLGYTYGCAGYGRTQTIPGQPGHATITSYLSA